MASVESSHSPFSGGLKDQPDSSGKRFAFGAGRAIAVRSFMIRKERLLIRRSRLLPTDAHGIGDQPDSSRKRFASDTRFNPIARSIKTSERASDVWPFGAKVEQSVRQLQFRQDREKGQSLSADGKMVNGRLFHGCYPGHPYEYMVAFSIDGDNSTEAYVKGELESNGYTARDQLNAFPLNENEILRVCVKCEEYDGLGISAPHMLRLKRLCQGRWIMLKFSLRGTNRYQGGIVVPLELTYGYENENAPLGTIPFNVILDHSTKVKNTASVVHVSGSKNTINIYDSNFNVKAGTVGYPKKHT